MSAVETPSSPEQAQEPMLEFKFPTDGTEQVDARTLVRWCSHRRLLTELEGAGFRDPRLVIVVRGPREVRDGSYSDTEYEDTAVYCVPLTAEMHHMYFHRPGTNQIRALIVEYANKRTREWVREQVNVPRLRLSGAEYVGFSSLYRNSGELAFGHMPQAGTYFDTGTLETVEVPATLFAPPPTGWKKRFVARYYRGKPYDECDFRSQVVGSFARAAFFATIGTVVRVLLLIVGLIFGLRDIDWKAIGRPLEPRLGVLANTAIDDDVWFHEKPGQLKLSPLNLINPFVLVITPNLLYGISQLHHSVTKHHHTYHQPLVKTGYWECAAWVDGVIVGFVLFVVLVALLAMGLVWVVNAISGSHLAKNSRLAKAINARLEAMVESRADARKRRVKEAEVQKEQDLKQIQKAVAAMTCQVTSEQVSIAALPKEKRTIRLRASQAKVALCRPFAR